MSAEIDYFPKDDDGMPKAPSAVPPPQELLDMIESTKQIPSLVVSSMKEQQHRRVSWITRVGVILMYVWKILECVL